MRVNSFFANSCGMHLVNSSHHKSHLSFFATMLESLMCSIQHIVNSIRTFWQKSIQICLYFQDCNTWSTYDSWCAMKAGIWVTNSVWIFIQKYNIQKSARLLLVLQMEMWKRFIRELIFFRGIHFMPSLLLLLFSFNIRFISQHWLVRSAKYFGLGFCCCCWNNSSGGKKS